MKITVPFSFGPISLGLALCTGVLAYSPSVANAADVCQPVDACVATAVPQGVTSCEAATTACTAKPGVFAVTATELARRAISLKKCSTKKTRANCNLCYQRTKFPLQNRYDGQIFHGLLAHAVSLIEAERKTVCGALPKS